MGNQSGNLASQLLNAGTFGSRNEAKLWIRDNCVVQFLVVEDLENRRRAERFMLAILNPKFCD
jgi:hypothetical protein